MLTTIGALGYLSPPPLRKMRLPEKIAPKFIVRQGACFEPKAVGGGAIEARNDACTVFRYTATPGVNETGKLTGSGQG